MGIYQRFAHCVAIPAGCFMFGWLANGFDQLGVGEGVVGCFAAAGLFIWLSWNEID